MDFDDISFFFQTKAEGEQKEEVKKEETAAVSPVVEEKQEEAAAAPAPAQEEKKEEPPKEEEPAKPAEAPAQEVCVLVSGPSLSCPLHLNQLTNPLVLVWCT